MNEILIAVLVLLFILVVLYLIVKPYSQVVRNADKFKVRTSAGQVQEIMHVKNKFVKRLIINLVCADEPDVVMSITVNDRSESFNLAVGSSYIIDDFTDGTQLLEQSITVKTDVDASLNIAVLTIAPR